MKLEKWRPSAAWMRKHGPAIDAEEKAIDAITAYLMRPENRYRGRTIEEISVGTGLAIGRVEQVCKASEIVIKKIPGSERWRCDWRDLPPSYRAPAVAHALKMAA